MGNRVKGRAKKSSIKAASHSKMGSKRKLSRMGKKQKKHNAGLEATFIGRSKCLKMLQITIKDFRRLCILKGIFPREPRGRFPGHKKGQTFYHIKDIRAIAHEPILEKFREFRSFTKKVRRAAGRNEQDEALRKNAMCPTYTLHHLVRERYPRFNDAISDLDDALTLTYLFAALPSTTNIKAKVVNKAKTLAAAWGAYCSTAACITKSFISVKGIYLEATIRGVPVRWVVPHSFTQFMPEDVDYRVMTTFFEFYETLLNFTLYKLYNDIEVRYPLVSGGGEVKGSASYILGANLRSLTNALKSTGNISNIVSESVQGNDKKEKKKSKEDRKKEKELIKSVGAALNKINEDSDSEEEEDDVDVAGPLKAALECMADDEARAVVPGGKLDLDDESMKRRRLFSGFKFFLSREVPRGYLELVCLAFGGIVGWEGPNSPLSANDPTITHHVVDRPKLPVSYCNLPKSREFIQPQWILDCANNVFLLPIAKYSIGVALPPHLSPWVDNEEEGYKPAYAEELERLKNGEPAVMETDDDNNMDIEETAGDEKMGVPEEERDSETEDESEDESEEEEELITNKKKQDKKKLAAKKARAEKRQKEQEDEAHALAKTMMSRKASHLYGRMQHGIAQRNAKVDNLKNKRKAIEDEDRSKKKDNLGRTALKQKVDRLRSERKDLEDKYSNPAGMTKKSTKKKRSSTKK